MIGDWNTIVGEKQDGGIIGNAGLEQEMKVEVDKFISALKAAL